jgi:hypothetical protein
MRTHQRAWPMPMPPPKSCHIAPKPITTHMQLKPKCPTMLHPKTLSPHEPTCQHVQQPSPALHMSSLRTAHQPAHDNWQATPKAVIAHHRTCCPQRTHGLHLAKSWPQSTFSRLLSHCLLSPLMQACTTTEQHILLLPKTHCESMACLPHAHSFCS